MGTKIISVDQPETVDRQPRVLEVLETTLTEAKGLNIVAAATAGEERIMLALWRSGELQEWCWTMWVFRWVWSRAYSSFYA